MWMWTISALYLHDLRSLEPSFNEIHILQNPRLLERQKRTLKLLVQTFPVLQNNLLIPNLQNFFRTFFSFHAKDFFIFIFVAICCYLLLLLLLFHFPLLTSLSPSFSIHPSNRESIKCILQILLL